MSSTASRPTILLIEDDVSLGTAMERFLASAGYAPVFCRSGAAAIEAVETFHPDAIITDVHLPDINGLLLSRQFRDKFGEALPIIVLSGDTSTEVLKSLSYVGATYFFNKPVNLDLLRSHLTKYVGGDRAAEG